MVGVNGTGKTTSIAKLAQYYKDRGAGFLGLSAGEYDLREEFTSKSWATEYDIPQVRDGRIKLLTIPDERMADIHRRAHEVFSTTGYWIPRG